MEQKDLSLQLEGRCTEPKEAKSKAEKKPHSRFDEEKDYSPDPAELKSVSNKPQYSHGWV